MPSKVPRPTYRLRVTLLGMEPPIWRTMWVPSSIKLCCLHSALQVVMGWTDSHLHQFEQDGKNWGVPKWDEFDELDLIDESRTQLGKVLTKEGEALVYQYDFGDDWRHEVVLEKIIPVRVALTVPVCLR